MTKTCTKCGESEPIVTFPKREYRCTLCAKEYAKKYYEDNKDKIKADNKKYAQENKERVLEEKRKYNQEHKEEKKKYDIIYRQEKKEKIKEFQKQWFQKNKEEIKESRRIYQREFLRQRCKNDPAFNLRKRVSRSIGKIIKKKGTSCLNYLPWTPEELKLHIESLFEPWMTWQNHGSYNVKTWNDNDSSTWRWQLDHIIPHSAFKYTSMDSQEFRECWVLSNLRPLSAKQNLLDGARKINS